jgi:hypothetical protein
MENGDRDTVNYKIVAGVFASLILVLVGIIDRLYSTSSSQSIQYIRESIQRLDDRLATVEARQLELIEQTKYLARSGQDREERLRAVERSGLQTERERGRR